MADPQLIDFTTFMLVLFAVMIVGGSYAIFWNILHGRRK